jgi:hypothetical protein
MAATVRGWPGPHDLENLYSSYRESRTVPEETPHELGAEDRPDDVRTIRTRLREVVGFYVAASGLAAVILVVAIAVLSLPAQQKGQNIVAVSTSAFGVIGAIVGAYFGIRSANQAVQQLGQPEGPRPR